jgi:hypothetical protein
MASRREGVDFVESLRFVTQDPDWGTKVLVGGLVALAGIFILPAPLAVGYTLRITRSAATEAQPRLPEWTDWGGLFVDGLRVIGVGLAHALALLLVLGCPIGLLLVTGFVDQNKDSALGLLVFATLALPLLVFYLAVIVHLQVAVLRLAVTDSLAQAFDVRENLAFVGRNVLPLLLVLAVMLVGQLIANFGVLLCCVGVLFTAFWAQCTTSHALGRAGWGDPLWGGGRAA